ncbi:MAG: hypothetical protein U5K69_27170 [Balneolaceae bacterium]|nr:hypothetical protein [Balneolaceae bacterium]
MSDTKRYEQGSSPWKSLLAVLRGRRSRRFGLGMEMKSGPMAYQSNHEGLPLTEKEEALLAFAACGITGRALGDLVYENGEGGTIACRVGRANGSQRRCHPNLLPDCDEPGSHLLHKTPAGFSPGGDTGTGRACRAGGIRGALPALPGENSRRPALAPPVEPFFNINCNRWSLYDPAATYFLPVGDFTLMYINALLEIFNEHNGIYPLDERRASGRRASSSLPGAAAVTWSTIPNRTILSPSSNWRRWSPSSSLQKRE